MIILQRPNPPKHQIRNHQRSEKSTHCEEGSDDARIPVVGTHVRPIELLVLGSRRAVRELLLAEEIPLSRVRVRIALVAPMSDEVQPRGRRGRVVGAERLRGRVVAVEVCRRRGIPELASVAVIQEEAGREIQVGDGVVMSPEGSESED